MSRPAVPGSVPQGARPAVPGSVSQGIMAGSPGVCAAGHAAGSPGVCAAGHAAGSPGVCAARRHSRQSRGVCCRARGWQSRGLCRREHGQKFQGLCRRAPQDVCQPLTTTGRSLARTRAQAPQGTQPHHRPTAASSPISRQERFQTSLSKRHPLSIYNTNHYENLKSLPPSSCR